MKISPTIKNPCPADWDKMKIGVNSRYCGSCEKNVVDFTKKTREEILEYLILNYETQTCGHFYRHQLDYADTDFMVTVQALAEKQKDPRLAMALLVFGSLMMASCNSPAPSAPNDSRALFQKDSIEMVNQAEMQDSIISFKQDSIARQDSTLAAAQKEKDDSIKRAKAEEIEIPTIEGEVLLGDIDVIPLDSTDRQQTDPIDYVLVEVKPEFPGEMDGLQNYISQNITYPAKAKDAKEEGKVYITFIIDTEGKVTNPEVVRGASPALDSAALHTISNLPDWKPGEQRGQKVDVRFTVPVNFRLSK